MAGVGAVAGGGRMTDLVPAIVGQVVLSLIVLGVVWVALQRFLRVAAKVIAVVVALTALALWLGFLDRTTVVEILATVGDRVLAAIRAAVDWIAAVLSAA